VSVPYALTAGADALLAPRLEQRILPGLDRMQRALEALGHPERSLRSVLVLGTNGKGSTAALLAEILQAHGLTVGLYTSPHLVTVEERIRIGGATITRERLMELVAGLSRFPDLSYFETLTCAAVLEFVQCDVDVAIMEAGLGGRWDASNAVDPAVALLTNVGTDHQKWLGETRVAIAAEKAVALRGLAAIVGSWDNEVQGIICASANPTTPLSLASQWAAVTAHRAQGAGHSKGNVTGSPVRDEWTEARDQEVAFAVGNVHGLATLPLLGDHQLANLELALAGAAALAQHGIVPTLVADAVRRGIESVSWPGRLQWCSASGRVLLLDGAHNREAIAALARTLDSMGLSGRLNLVFSCLDDKPIEAMAAMLQSRVAAVTVVPINSPRARPLDELASAFPGSRRATSAAGVLRDLPDDPPTLVTGSLRLVGEVLAELGEGHG
jgi:dihydrofolate synthase/folylpolyglutamate synthase